jgi:hypothetical protein
LSTILFNELAVEVDPASETTVITKILIIIKPNTNPKKIVDMLAA